MAGGAGRDEVVAVRKDSAGGGGGGGISPTKDWLFMIGDMNLSVRKAMKHPDGYKKRNSSTEIMLARTILT
jgi:hypothetical protein